MSDKAKSDTPIDITSQEFQSDFDSIYNSMDSTSLDDMIVERYGQNAMDIEFPDLEAVDESNLIFVKIRGNTRLMDEAIMTYSESELIIESAIRAEL